ncbi:histidine kinase [Peribacillus castrilensis]|uniref:Osmosensitive K channel His kinase sensor n=1 Tax=Peribacillus simplex TaxID=1478 RepID=A0AAN2PI52_9BACI|nr:MULTISPECIES: histidine kinase [Peribacillus]MCP1153119.1 histidine kinase [Peribacillus frigoritolerans]MCT1390361.1 histidine kinase [Peribacillus frigoritolerans]MEA3576980.1 histidine kinase [Peribacillus frigoritolerans]NCT38273.1 histidine kinase [Peribacillus frigoritolerans]CEG32579.1 osmosensitive K channel His kinase sensor [Peribacillus simplex]
MSEQFRRKTPGEILESISNIKRGRLKIILGAVSGSGKTYHMLLEGNELKERGIDVVVGVVNKSCSGTLKQLGSLELIPTIEWEQNGHIEQDIDLEKIYKRNPEVVLIDRLAHKNHIHAKNATRLDDVKELINNEISVITTLNIYELKGVKKVAEQLLNVSLHVEVTLPEDTLTKADEVRLLDVTPEAILKRLQKGEISEQDECPLQFYNNGNLATLRELSLRFLAEEVEVDLTEHREQEGLMGPSGATERILVCVQYHWNGSILIRRGDQIAKRLGGEFLIASFIPLAKKLSKEEEIFKSSMQKLVNKLNGRFFEIIMNGDEIAEGIVVFSMQHRITRIILGHSKKSVWEEAVNGSIVNKIMRKSKSIDVYIMADLVKAFGERTIPAIKKDKKKGNPYRRLSNDEMRDKVERVKKGTFKIFIGAAPGVGKTYTMLREANQLKENEMDVVIGLLEAHGRKETIAQVGNLEILPKKRIRYKNVLLEEMDLDAIISRNPEVVLIDELAHTNVPGNKNHKRYQDVMDILDAGISVISTMNIQHIESLKDSVKQITGVSVRETVPDSILQLSDELELIDISPNALRKRMEEGNIYAMDKVEQSLSHFFKTQNLIALRELVLRELADDVDDRLESKKRKEGVRGPWRKDEVIFVCVNLRADSERLIRRGFRIAYRLKAEWYVIFVKHPNERQTDEKLILDKLISLTHRLGGTFELYTTRDRRSVFKEIKKQLQTKKATQIILGQSARTRWQEIVGGSIVARLLREVRHLDVLIVAD